MSKPTLTMLHISDKESKEILRIAESGELFIDGSKFELPNGTEGRIAQAFRDSLKAFSEAQGINNGKGTFGDALSAMKVGRRVARAGWNGKGMYLWLLPSATVKKEWVKDPMLFHVFGERDELSCLGSIRMLTATGEVLTGWLASQSDMLAEDWTIVE